MNLGSKTTHGHAGMRMEPASRHVSLDQTMAYIRFEEHLVPPLDFCPVGSGELR
ncbi:MAG: hypothetical protein RMJ35_13790 [Phycisphaerales bacterium]|nr:hypothetical protein [Phycisphaerales bacterium]